MEENECNLKLDRPEKRITTHPGINEIVFHCGEEWILKFTKDSKIEFNREHYPNATPNDFVEKFMEILEECINVTFNRKQPFAS